MQRFVALAILVIFAFPVGISLTGCSRNKNPQTFCNGGDSGIRTGQITTINFEPRLTGISLSNGQNVNPGAATATDCKGTDISVIAYSYGTSDITLADINPATGAVCAGSWNRNTAGGIPDFTFCNSTGKTGVAYITASAGGATSNKVPVYVHPIIGSIALDNSLQQDCTSQGRAITLSARAFDTAGRPIDSSIVGRLSFVPQNSTIVTIDENGVATAQAPGSTLITATISNTTSTAGYFFTCPPASIKLSLPGTSSTSANVSANNTQPIVATIQDKNGVTMANVPLTFASTSPSVIPVTSGGSTTPIFPGYGSIMAFCSPPTCNPSPSDHIGLFGNGKAVASNLINITSTGRSSTIVYAASTQSQYLVPIDLTSGSVGSGLRLPFVPNSMVVSNSGEFIYLGSDTELMVVNAANNTINREDQGAAGRVVSVSPDSGTVVITNPARGITFLQNSSGTNLSTYGGVATRASWSADSSTLYVTTADNRLLTYTAQTGWQALDQTALTTTANDVTATVPGIGAYIGGSTATIARSYCHRTTYGTASNGQQTVTSIEYFPVATPAPVPTPNDRVTATQDGKHILGAALTAGVPVLNDISITLPTAASTPASGCPTPSGATATFTTNGFTQTAFPTAPANAITGIFSSADSAIAFVTYDRTGTAGTTVLPGYLPSTGTAANVTLAGNVVAPVSGIFSTDNNIFFVGTSGDNLIHYITKQTNGAFTDAKQVDPKLNAISGTGFAVPNLIGQRPRSFQ